MGVSRVASQRVLHRANVLGGGAMTSFAGDTKLGCRRREDVLFAVVGRCARYGVTLNAIGVPTYRLLDSIWWIEERVTPRDQPLLVDRVDRRQRPQLA